MRSSLLLIPTLAALVAASGCTTATLPQRTPVPAHETASIDPAITAVYPALVQILVITEMTEGGRLAKEQAAGSGAIISAQGHVVTNHHVVGRATAVRCILADRSEVDAEVVGSDALCDIAVVRLKLPPGRTVPAIAAWGDSAAMRVGDPVYAMGCPFALAQSVTRGIVSNPSMTLPKLFGGSDAFKLDGEAVGSLVTWLAHDAVIFPGNSGGPLVDAQGRIIGINEIGIGLGGAIPASIARVVADALIAHGTVDRAWIGLGLRPLLRDAAASERGVLIADVRKGSPADGAGLRRGDRLLAVAGTAVTARHDEELPAIMRLLVALPIGAPVSLRIANAAGEREVSLSPLLRDAARARDRDISELGAIVRRVSRDEAAERHRGDTRGALIGGLRGGGPAATATPPLASGDVIVSLDGKAIADDLDLATRCAERCAGGPATLLLEVSRRREVLICRVEAGLRPQAPPVQSARRPSFPGRVQAVTPALATSLGLPAAGGVRITALRAGAPAGLQVGDIILKVDDQLLEVRRAQDETALRDLIAAYDPGVTVRLTVRRAAGDSSVELVLGEGQPSGDELPPQRDHRLECSFRDLAEDDRERLGWPSELSGALISEADAGGWAAVAGLRADDLIIELDGAAVGSSADLVRLLAATPADRPRSAIAIRRGAATQILELERSR